MELRLDVSTSHVPCEQKCKLTSTRVEDRKKKRDSSQSLGRKGTALSHEKAGHKTVSCHKNNYSTKNHKCSPKATATIRSAFTLLVYFPDYTARQSVCSSSSSPERMKRRECSLFAMLPHPTPVHPDKTPQCITYPSVGAPAPASCPSYVFVVACQSQNRDTKRNRIRISKTLIASPGEAYSLIREGKAGSRLTLDFFREILDATSFRLTRCRRTVRYHRAVRFASGRVALARAHHMLAERGLVTTSRGFLELERVGLKESPIRSRRGWSCSPLPGSMPGLAAVCKIQIAR